MKSKFTSRTRWREKLEKPSSPLRAEGFTVIPSGKKPAVKDFEHRLYTFK
jgi:hypothetical protein